MSFSGLRMWLSWTEHWLGSYLLSSDSVSANFEKLYDRTFWNMRRTNLFTIKGNIKGSSRDVTVFLKGYPETAHTLARLSCWENENMNAQGAAFHWQKSPRISTDADITMVCAPRQYTGRLVKDGYLLLPAASFVLDLNKPIDQIMARMSARRRREIRKLSRYQYSYSLSGRNSDKFDEFYWNMYVPYVRKRFQEAAWVEHYATLRSSYRRNGAVLTVTRKNQPLSGILFQTKKKTVKALALGIYEGRSDIICDFGGQAALFFLLEWAKGQGYKKLDYGPTLPFLRDGILTYKKEWGMRMENTADRQFCSLKINRVNPGTLSFLQQNPFVYSDGDSLKALVFTNHNPTETEIKEIVDRNFIPGLESLAIISCYMPTEDKKEHGVAPSETERFSDLPKSVSALLMTLNEQNYEVSVTFVNRMAAGYSIGSRSE